MSNYDAVVALQDAIAELNHKLSSPDLKREDRLSIERDMLAAKSNWYEAMCVWHASPEYRGENAYQPENNPFKAAK